MTLKLLSTGFSTFSLVLSGQYRLTCGSFLKAPSVGTQIGNSRVLRNGPLFASLSFDSSGSTSEEQEDKWERMYAAGDNSHKFDSIALRPVAEVRVVSFDLDNTLWKTSDTISDANNGLADFLNEKNIKQSKRTEQVMGDIFKKSKSTYCPLEGEDAKSPVNLTQLRKDALVQILVEENDYSLADAKDFADEAFEKWTAARYESILSNFASDVLPCLEKISSIRSKEEHQSPVVVIAITDGNSDPRKVPGLEKYFELCINAEAVGVSKPDERVYREAVFQLQSHPSLSDIFTSEIDLTIDFKDILGPWWVHVGDDFLKDVVAAKTLNMRTVWSQELIRQKLSEAKEGALASDYLSSAVSGEFADATILEFRELADVLQKWHTESSASNRGEAVDGSKNYEEL